jgi:hypothetical protein
MNEYFLDRPEDQILVEDLLLVDQIVLVQPVDRNVVEQSVEDEEMVARHILQHVVDESMERDVYFVYETDVSAVVKEMEKLNPLEYQLNEMVNLQPQ